MSDLGINSVIQYIKDNKEFYHFAGILNIRIENEHQLNKALFIGINIDYIFDGICDGNPELLTLIVNKLSDKSLSDYYDYPCFNNSINMLKAIYYRLTEEYKIKLLLLCIDCRRDKLVDWILELEPNLLELPEVDEYIQKKIIKNGKTTKSSRK